MPVTERPYMRWTQETEPERPTRLRAKLLLVLACAILALVWPDAWVVVMAAALFLIVAYYTGVVIVWVVRRLIGE